MPGAKGEGRPQTRTFMKLGRVLVNRPDTLNWSVEDGSEVRYYRTLPSAIRHAVAAAAETRATNAAEWLAEYERITNKLESSLKRALAGYTLDGPGEGD